jgi:hypothetical protein
VSVFPAEKLATLDGGGKSVPLMDSCSGVMLMR